MHFWFYTRRTSCYYIVRFLLGNPLVISGTKNLANFLQLNFLRDESWEAAHDCYFALKTLQFRRYLVLIILDLKFFPGS